MSKLPNEIKIVWSVDDVKSIAADLTDDECRQVLSLAEKYHDATVGINWDVLEVWVDKVRAQRQR